jgi:hypothetical protein
MDGHPDPKKEAMLHCGKRDREKNKAMFNSKGSSQKKINFLKKGHQKRSSKSF